MQFHCIMELDGGWWGYNWGGGRGGGLGQRVDVTATNIDGLSHGSVLRSPPWVTLRIWWGGPSGQHANAP